MNSGRVATFIVINALLMGCSIQRHSSDPLPFEPLAAVSTTTTLSPTPVVSEQRPALPPATKLPTRAGAPSISQTRLPQSRHTWGLIAITTAIISPSSLIGPEVAYSSAFKSLPVFPEKLTFDVSWGLLSVGQATLNVDKIVLFNGRPAYHLISEARSNSFCDTFFSVRDINESWVDAQTLTSLGYSKKLREGHFFRDEWVLYDRDANTFAARATNRDGSYRIRVGTIPAQVQDVLSSVYFTRSQNLSEGKGVVIDVNTPDNWPLVVNVVKKESVRKRPAILVEPAMRREGLFIQKGKRMQLWLSETEQHVPLLLKVEVFFGHVTAVLREML